MARVPVAAASAAVASTLPRLVPQCVLLVVKALPLKKALARALRVPWERLAMRVVWVNVTGVPRVVPLRKRAMRNVRIAVPGDFPLCLEPRNAVLARWVHLATRTGWSAASCVNRVLPLMKPAR